MRKLSNLYNDYYLGNISITENEQSMTSTDRKISNDQTSSLSTDEKSDNENKSSEDEDADELADEEEMRVCQ